MKLIIVTGLAFLLFSCTNNGDRSSSPDPEIDSAKPKTVNASGTDANARDNEGRMGDSTGTRSPHLSKDSLRH